MGIQTCMPQDVGVNTDSKLIEPEEIRMQVWLFQSIKREYDLVKEFHLGKVEPWRVKNFKEEMKVGEIVLLWIAGGDAGIYGVGRLVRPLYERNGKKRWVDVKYLQWLAAPVLKTTLLKNPVLARLEVIRTPFAGTSSRVYEKQWKALQEVIPIDPNEFLRKKGEEEANAGAFDPENTEDARERTLTSIVLRRGQPAFRKKLLRLCKGRCLVTGCDVEQALEAAHILPYKGEHTNHPSNGLLLRADLHTLFDLHLVAVDTKNMSLLLAPALKKTSYSDLEGKRLNVRHNGGYKLNKTALDEHRTEFEKIAG
jgi:hypothetical protein